jgi:chemotaxis protein methyltransferase CheR
VSQSVTRHELERFRATIIRGIGLQFDDAKLGFLGEVLERRLDKLGRPGAAYLSELEQGRWHGEFTALAQELTVGETYFFRNNEQFRALAEVALPERIRANGAAPIGLPKTLRLLSAGCASGEEAYSMAIVARTTVTDACCDVLIRAVDLNPSALAKAARARYSSWALRDTPADIQRQWFRPDGREMILDEALRAAVRFGAGNLASDDPELWQPGAYDVVFCRNVLMYFSPEQMCAAIARIAQSLAPGGFLFLGHAETLRGVSEAFHLRHTHGTFYYERKESIAPSGPRPQQAMPKSPPPAAAPVAALGAAWFDEIREASARVAALVPLTAAAIPLDDPPPLWDVAPALDLLRQERFVEALAYVRTGPPRHAPDPDIQLLEATLLAHSGQLVAAEDTCLRLLLIDELNAGAHYVLALCREHSGNRERACEHDRVAAYLDPAFAMPRLHLGLLARRAGDRDGARRELAQASVLLKREDASRLLLFGGGFNREALLVLCETALRECGGRP